MRRLCNRLFLPALVAGIAVSLVWAGEFVCIEPVCTAYKVTGGVAKQQLFARGDLVSTDEGWVVNEAHGWDQLD